MKDITLSFSILLGVILLHALWCRMRKTGELEVLPFIALAFFGFLVHVRVFAFAPSFPVAEAQTHIWDAPFTLTPLVFYPLSALIYFTFYFNTRVESPSQRILRFLKTKKNMSHEELRRLLTDEKVILPRLNDLVRFGFLAFDGKEYRLRPTGKKVAQALKLYQVFLGREIGG